MGIAFRPFTRADFPLMRTWLEEPLVKRWWNHETSDESLERYFGASIDGKGPTVLHIASDGRGPFGFAQRYRLADAPGYVEELTAVYPPPPAALSIDYLIGEPSRRGEGLGAAMIAAYMAEAWIRYPEATHVVVPVAAGNRASWRALERAGFKRVAEGELEPDNPIDPPDHVVYALARPDSLVP